MSIASNGNSVTKNRAEYTRENDTFLEIQENAGIKKNTGKYRNRKNTGIEKIQESKENTGMLRALQRKLKIK